MAGLFELIDESSIMDALRRREVSSNPHDPNAPMLPHSEMMSSKGATGEMQIIPKMAMDPGYGSANIFDVGRSLGFDVTSEDEATARLLANDPGVAREYAKNYLSSMYDKFGNIDQAVGAYNAGPGAMNAVGSDYSSLPQETQDYITHVRRFYGENSGDPYGVGMSPRPQARPVGLLD